MESNILGQFPENKIITDGDNSNMRVILLGNPQRVIYRKWQQ